VAEGSNGQEKTEQPTSKHRRDARREGNVFQSKDVATVVMLFGVFWMLRLWIPTMHREITGFLKETLDRISLDDSLMLSVQILYRFLWVFVKCAVPLLLVSMLLGILSHGLQTRFNISFKVIRPKFSKLNPISGLKKLFSLKKVVELLKNLVKLVLLIFLLYNMLKDQMIAMSRMIDMTPMSSAVSMLDTAFNLVMKVCIAFTVVAFFDFLYQRWDYEKNLKMTKQEVKDEYKQTEGNPEIKGRIRRIQRQMAQSRMMQKVPQADVIIRNPTHFAVALKYEPKKHGAPIVLAKGQDKLALRIIHTGEEHGVSIIENRPLARALYAACDLDREIPAEYYGAVAEILVYIYKQNHREEMFR